MAIKCYKDIYPNDIPKILYDNISKRSYRRFELLGKGGFAQCYEIHDTSNNTAYAGKVYSKKSIAKKNVADKIEIEIGIHRNLNHPNIVKFYNAFENDGHMCIVLELCKNRTLMDFHNVYQIVSVRVCGFFIHQILKGVKYLHDQQIIHRDLKLKNIFLNEQLHVKIGDFGLATRVEYEGECKTVICGTPNYMAPEMLCSRGYSYEVDIWAIGCIMYTLLHAHPPFDSKSAKQIYRKIRNCDYQLNKYLPKPAADVLSSILQINPKRRPTIGQLLNSTFMEKATNSNRLELLGKGGFAQCCDIHDIKNNAAYANKVFSKALIAKKNLTNNLENEIDIHRNPNHANIIKYNKVFNDDGQICTEMQLCKYRTMMQFHNVRKIVSVCVCPFIHQILKGMKYLHDPNLHRAMKLRNTFLNEWIAVKSGNFVLVTRTVLGINPKKCPTIGQLLNSTFMEKDILSLPLIPIKAKKSVILVILDHIQQNTQQEDSILKNSEVGYWAWIAKRGDLMINEEKLSLIQQAVVCISDCMDLNGFSHCIHVLKSNHVIVKILFDQETNTILSLEMLQMNSRSLSHNNLRAKVCDIFSHHHLHNIPVFRKIVFDPKSISKNRSASVIIIYLTNDIIESNKLTDSMKITFSTEYPSTNSICGTTAMENMCNADNSASTVVMQNGFTKYLYIIISYVFKKFKRLLKKFFWNFNL